ncbi:MAG TPA: thiolase domain-containing protein [Microthrixaceae bacterium]|nr:MAG: thiolase domain-containing protein [Acidimicrobiia bacterium]HMX66964.1 thiolase domain-containing protein [Microthrixaceae bacterium]HNE38039.1 thiolase domain-containing protein [Microthrixaceae bacterium]HNG25153.1 thiolase domain-containing protein [Microthrixaceae bacterium]HNJ68451.1 thiolase domain-containing protein [Microthrixaceae bacterium]
MGANRVAVIGVGQTKYASVRGDVSLPGLLREAAYRALADAHLTMDDIDAVVVGKAPDFFEGIMMPEPYLAEALGAVGKPLFRVHTAGSVGGSTAIVAASHVEAGVHERVLTIGWQQQSVSEAMWALSFPIPFQQQLVAGAGGYFAPFIREYMRRSGAPDDIGILVALKDRLNALKNPYAHLHEPDITYDSIKESFMLWEPIRYAETCPSSDGAFAMVLGGERAAEEAQAATGVPPAWIHATAMRSEPSTASGRDQVRPQASLDCAADLYRQAGITDPRAQIDVAEIYVPFSWYEPMWMEGLLFAEEGDGWKMTESGATALTGDLPVNCSGGVLSTNPIGASGMIRFGEAAMQVRGQAGDHQVDGARVALGHAYGGAAQFYAMWIVSSDRP